MHVYILIFFKAGLWSSKVPFVLESLTIPKVAEMAARQYLHFLRPFVFTPIAKKEIAYIRFFSAACSIARIHHVCSNEITPVVTGRRYLHNSTVRDLPASELAISQGDAETGELPCYSTAFEGRIQKLGEYGALRYPRISPRGNRVSIPKFRQTYANVTTSTPASEEVLLHGRIMSLRKSGPKLVFMDLRGDFETVQVMVNQKNVAAISPEEFKRTFHPMLRGDIVSVTGTAMRTTNGELSLNATALPHLLSPSLAPLPEKLIDEESRILYRHVDLLVNRQTTDVLRLRSHVLKYLRDFLHKRDFLEVQTPVLADYAGGAVARPFLTSATEFPSKGLALRVAPELWLKRLVSGGLDRVFEIGTAFRNEGLDTMHNPEFTLCEFYSAFSDLQDLITTTETMIRGLLEHTKQLKENTLTTLKIPELAEQNEGGWKQVEFIPALEEALGITLPDLSGPGALRQLAELVDGKTPRFSATISLNGLLDHLASAHLEGGGSRGGGGAPLFITHHPACMAPLAKSFTCPRTGQLVSARAELFVAGREIANMYEEENSPFEQRRKFEQQVRLSRDDRRVGHDAESQARVDESYVQVLAHGLPPTGGWGCGVDRLVMLLSGAPRISDVLSFGSLRNVVSVSHAIKK